MILATRLVASLLIGSRTSNAVLPKAKAIFRSPVNCIFTVLRAPQSSVFSSNDATKQNPRAAEKNVSRARGCRARRARKIDRSVLAR